MSREAEFPSSFVEPWRELLHSRRDEQADDFPNYHVAEPETLLTQAIPRSLYVGTGYSIFNRALLPAILAAKHSILFVTCYWAASPTLDAFRETLLQLAAARSHSRRRNTLRITIGFSSSGLFQKLFHTTSRNGSEYPPAQWAKLGLPEESVLKAAGIEMTVKSLFFIPFSVMHPKYVVVDGAKAWVPSCNVSWERWFEGCVALEGEVVGKLLKFHESVWGGLGNMDAGSDSDSMNEGIPERHDNAGNDKCASQSLDFTGTRPVPTIFLPSSHHRNPRFSFFPFLSQANPPMTPLNAALLTLFANAQRTITITTPNMTSWPVLDALLAALGRGVDVQIRTSKNMMLIEQLVTAGTTTSWCLRQFIDRYRRLLDQPRRRDPEMQTVAPGKLQIWYYQPLWSRQGAEDEPNMLHFKMTLVDDEYLVLGSGNMDRASWWTSQELGILFYLPGFEGHRLWERVLKERAEVVYQS